MALNADLPLPHCTPVCPYFLAGIAGNGTVRGDPR